MSYIFIYYFLIKSTFWLINLLTVQYFKPQISVLWFVQGLLHQK